MGISFTDVVHAVADTTLAVVAPPVAIAKAIVDHPEEAAAAGKQAASTADTVLSWTNPLYLAAKVGTSFAKAHPAEASDIALGVASPFALAAKKSVEWANAHPKEFQAGVEKGTEAGIMAAFPFLGALKAGNAALDSAQKVVEAQPHEAIEGARHGIKVALFGPLGFFL